jgi:NitT/TauT family transport system substrate-binding protein
MAGLLGWHSRPVAAEPPPETNQLTLLNRPVICVAPQYVAEELLRGEGFDEVRYLKVDYEKVEQSLASGKADMSILYAPSGVARIDAGDPTVLIGGVHAGCLELLASDPVRTISDLRDKTIVTNEVGGPLYIFLASILAYVGLNPNRDVRWAIHPLSEWERLFVERKIDALLGFPPLAQQMRARKVGHVVLNTTTDRPWSQYFCCMVAANRDFVRKHPIATKRALRAILKASNICALEPERVAQFLVDKGYVERSDATVQSMKEVEYGKWREYEPEDAVRFYALRLHEVGLIKSSPQKIIAQGTDWRFFNELKKELKG